MMVAANLSLPHVLAFCSSVVSDAVPRMVPCRPSPQEEDVDNYFTVVAAQLAAKGGTMIIGWAIWELPGVFIEAVFQPVWQSPEGEILDIAPQRTPCTEITFVPDAGRRYNNRLLDNIRKPLVVDNDVTRLLFLCHRRFVLLNAGNRAMGYDGGLQKAEKRELETNLKETFRLEDRIYRRYLADL